jgi:diacylglycerol kinase (ATP)
VTAGTTDDAAPFDARTTVVIGNPTARGGQVGRRWARIERLVRTELGSVQLVKSMSAESIPHLVAHAARSGATTIVSLGGDGHHGAIANALLRLAPPYPVLGIAHAGSGGDFRRNLAGADDLRSSLRLIRNRAPAPIDVLEVTCHDDAGTARTRYALNAASCGLSAAVVDAIAQRGRGRFGYAAGALAAFKDYRRPVVEVSIDGLVRGAQPVTLLAICNGTTAGGGLRFAPDAMIGDGQLDCTMIAHAPFARSLPLLAALRTRRAVHPLVTRVQGERVDLRMLEGGDDRVEVDGELVGRLPVSARLCPARLRVWGA